jgi:PKD repeat protein
VMPFEAQFTDVPAGNYTASGTHTFAAGGTYTIRLIVTDANGLEDSEKQWQVIVGQRRFLQR